MSWSVTLSLATKESAQFERLVSAVERVAQALEQFGLSEVPTELRQPLDEQAAAADTLATAVKTQSA